MRGGITCNLVLEHRVRYHQAAAFNNLALGALNGLRIPRALQPLVSWNCYAVNRDFELFTQLGFSHWPRPLEDRHDRKRRRVESKNDRTDATQGKLRKYGFEILTRCTAIGDLAQGRVRSLPYQPSWSALKLRKQVTDPVWTGGHNGTCGHVSYNQTREVLQKGIQESHLVGEGVCRATSVTRITGRRSEAPQDSSSKCRIRAGRHEGRGTNGRAIDMLPYS